MGAARTRGTLAYFKSNTWSNLQKRTINGSTPHISNKSYLAKGIELRLTKDEFYAWCDLNATTIMSLYAAGETPSINRIDHLGHYQDGNIEIITLDANRAESQTRSLVTAVLAATKAKLKPVVLIHPDGKETSYSSIKEAAATLGLRATNISQVLSGSKKTHRGYKARFESE